MRGPDEAEFGEVVAGRSHALRRTAYLMCGDWHQAEDLVQMTFIKLHAAWYRVRRGDNVDAYLRKTLLRTCIDEKRRGWWRRESPTSLLPDGPAAASAAGPEAELSDRDMLVAGLRRISAGQRAVLVLRFWEDLSVEETARVLGCSTGTVKSQTARGLAALRAVIASPAHAARPGSGSPQAGPDFGPARLEASERAN